MTATSLPPATRPGWVDDALFPFESRFLSIDGHHVHYVDEGSGPTLLLLHGNPTWSFVYRQVIADLRGDHRCIALDYPGFGLSGAAPGYDDRPESHAGVVSEFVATLGLDQITLVAHDWGGPIGLHAVQRAPDRFTGLALGNTWAWPVGDDPHFAFFARLMGGPLGAALIRRANLFVNVMIPIGHRRRRPTPAEMAHYRAPFPTPASRRPTAVLPHAILSAQPFLERIEAGLPAIAHLPSLLLWADRDIAFRTRERARWESLLTDHRTVVLSGAGHYLPSDAPAEFSETLRRWLRERRPTAPPAARA